MRGLLIKGMEVKEVQANGLEDYYRLMEIDTIDIVARKINGKYYDIICDDEALLKENPMVTVIDVDKIPMIFGNIIVAGLGDETGEMTDLTDEDIVRIIDSLRIGVLSNGIERACLVNVDY